MSAQNPSPTLIVRAQNGRVYYEAKFRYRRRQVMRRVGPAWLEQVEGTDEWRPRRGRIPEGHYDERRAHVEASKLVAAYVAQADEADHAERERMTRGVTFRELAHAYLDWLENVKGAKPTTMRDRWHVLAEPDQPYKRGSGRTLGHVMRALGDKPAKSVTTRDVEALLTTVAATGVSARAVNKTLAIVSSCFNYGMKSSTYGLPANPAKDADKRREPHPGVLLYYSPEEIEALARTLSDGLWREVPEHPHRPRCGHKDGKPCRCSTRYLACGRWFDSREAATTYQRDHRTDSERAEDEQLAELVRVAAYTGLRMGEVLALRWGHVDFAGTVLTISRAMSAGVETGTKSGRPRRVALPDQAAAALDRLSRRENFTADTEFVFVNEIGGPLDDSWLRKRFTRARVAAGLRPLRFHDLRHTYGSLLAKAGVDLVTIKEVMGHADLKTTARYLHARPASQQAAIFTAAFRSEEPDLQASLTQAASPAQGA